MFDGVLNTPVFRLHLVIFCVIIANIWWGQKITLTTCLQKARRARDPSHLSLLILYNTHAPSWITASTIQKNGNHHHFFIWIPILYCWQNPCSDCNSGTDLVVILEYIFFNFVSTRNKSLRFTRFRRSYVNCTTVVVTNHCKVTLLFCSMSPVPYDYATFVPNDSEFA